MTRLAILLLACLLAGPALALTCLPRDVPYLYQRADEAEEAYVLAHGRLTFDESALPRADVEDQADRKVRIPAHFDGQALSRAGFVVPFDRAITLVVECFAVWCPSPKSGTAHLAFLRQTAEGYRLRIDPCGGMTFSEPSQDELDQALQCLRGGPCTSEMR
jgi:urease beta subunit